MTDLTQAARQALPLLERDCTSLLACHQDPETGAIPAEEPEVVAMYDEYVAAIAALRAALEAQQEPVAWRYWKDKFGCWEYSDAPLAFPAVPAGTKLEPLYAHPPAQGWVPVTERLPEPDSGEVLVYLSGGMYALDEWHTHREDPLGMSTVHTIDMGHMWRTFDFDEVTHWMPLPPAPKETT